MMQISQTENNPDKNPFESLKSRLDVLERSKIRLPGIHRYFDKFSNGSSPLRDLQTQ